MFQISFGCKNLEYLRHIISTEGFNVDLIKIEDMQNWPVFKSLKILHGFLGLIGYYRKFIKYYGKIKTPFITLLKNKAYTWSPIAEESFY